MNPEQFRHQAEKFPGTEKMPALFVGHGSPLNGIEDNTYSRAWKELGGRLPRPAAVLSVSAHWLTHGTSVHTSPRPRTIHDFWGFPEELYGIEYACPGAPELAEDLISLVRKTRVERDRDWGLDHGTWVPLLRLFPDADIPVFQLSIDMSKPSEFHYRIGKELAPLRDKGVLIVGSGNIVHNLGRVDYDPDADPYDWSIEFDELSRKLIEEGDHEALIEYTRLGPAAMLSIPTPDHYWPLLYILALKGQEETVGFPVNGIAHGSVSMRAVAIGF
ncbi:MAG: 4,5-DOPA dioxygenase extradiol [Actinobacteria bacterium]|nr:4,5-DOPA dioxygenase extradiol [Actinomycetota bacterium]